MVVEAFSAWCESAERVIKIVSKAIASRSNRDPDFAAIQFRRALAVTLQRQNARTLMSRGDPEEGAIDEPMENG